MPKVKGKQAGEHLVIHRFVRISARKCRKVVDMVRGKNVDEALEILRRDPHRGSYFAINCLKSAWLVHWKKTSQTIWWLVLLEWMKVQQSSVFVLALRVVRPQFLKGRATLSLA